MTKQEEIREGIAEYIRLHYIASLQASEITSDAILKYLHSQDVVIKKKKQELPLFVLFSRKAPVTIEKTLITPNIKRMIKALNLVAVEPLMKERKPDRYRNPDVKP